ncbi:ParA family protein [Caulifigura coniformis]|nr:ParA family protein [Caulifigura coniformis]
MTECQHDSANEYIHERFPAHQTSRSLAAQTAGSLALQNPTVPENMPDRLLEIMLASTPELWQPRLMIIVIANSKGGVGKSTLAVHIAAWLNRQGHRVTLADCDTQQSSSEWIREAAPDVKAIRLDNPDMILNELPLLGADTDYVVADGPGSQSETSRALLLRADLAIVPCKASMLEVRALAKATEALRQAQDIRKGKPEAKIVLSMVGKNYRLTQDMKDAASALGLPMAHTALILRQIYADSPGQGATVWDLGSRAKEAADEVETLLRELLPQACRKQPARRLFAAKRSRA